MKYIADLHIHSHYSLATSKQLVPEYLEYWARIKGITVVGTGDFTHPKWTAELKTKLEPAEQGLYKLKDDLSIDPKLLEIRNLSAKVRFILSAEISNIYKKNGKVRKVHNVVYAPSFEIVDRVQQELARLKFNITSDGRPILGLDSRDLLDLLLNISDEILLVPAHIWTPWFSALGSKSGFDSISECYGDLSNHIVAVETGLSTDAPTNWMCSFLDKYTLISNSDAHSPDRLGRNANIFTTDLSYSAMYEALKTGSPDLFGGTIDMFPQEGKYHYDGHRKCNVCWNPVETLRNAEICPVCGKKVTVGVMSRIAELSDRENIEERPNKLPFQHIIPLPELLSEILKVGVNSKKLKALYNSIIENHGSELSILIDKPLEALQASGNEILAEAIRRMREGSVYISEGYDGEYGVIKVFAPEEVEKFGSKDVLFDDLWTKNKAPQRKLLNFDLAEYRALQLIARTSPFAGLPISYNSEAPKILQDLNNQQLAAATHTHGSALVLAGPGTGKTRVLMQRIANMILNEAITPESILAVTFTNKAADEMRNRLKTLLDNATLIRRTNIMTFHALGYLLVSENLALTQRVEGFSIIDDSDRDLILKHHLNLPASDLKNAKAEISRIKQQVLEPSEIDNSEFAAVFDQYQKTLITYNLFDLDDLGYVPVVSLRNNSDIAQQYRSRFQWISVDEYQDINQAQYALIKLLLPEIDPNLFVIGDPNQAIYGFRGADIRFIQRFFNDFSKAKVYALTQSYRCSDLIIKASTNIVAATGAKPEMISGLPQGIKINIARTPSDKSEAEFVARTIEKMIGGLRFFSMDSNVAQGDKEDGIESLSDFAVLCRTRMQMDTIVEAFHNHAIPYQLVGDEPFFKLEPVSTVIQWYEYALNPTNTFLKQKILNTKKANAGILDEVPQIVDNKRVGASLQKIVATYFHDENATHELYFRELIRIANDFADVNEFMKFVKLGSGIDTYQPNIENVAIMTLHASKGLEFKCVFIVGCEDGLCPYALYKGMEADVAEERRLLYVGMTRAEKFLYLSHADRRMLRGREFRLPRSPFIADIEKELIAWQKSEQRKKQVVHDGQLKLFDV